MQIDEKSKKIQELVDFVIPKKDIKVEIEVVEDSEVENKNNLTDLVNVFVTAPQNTAPTEPNQERQVTNSSGDKITLNL